MIFHAKLVMSSDLRFLPALRGAMEQMTSAFGWSETECRAIALAFQEALSNKIRHAYHGRADGLITVELQERDGNLEFQLTDQGEPPDVNRICARIKGSATPGGLGTHIIHDVMDGVSYRTLPDGNHLILSRKLPAAYWL